MLAKNKGIMVQIVMGKLVKISQLAEKKGFMIKMDDAIHYFYLTIAKSNGSNQLE